ncbi:Holliday junction DNA helicase RuvA [Gloeothece citriformis PCC 7424]|uniref:Holliday junction branch migration complex subunit RuvA n=1 Tax=Gloeothece citriformis (strain PCC 7424) TaxID=65393 RepID=RUVA_GLOC7|nr:Holliday junction branch migration protein RuvA [Gloeothece citriformis]B7K970.1 RecName: Full=Holliday junction branch migration complex subunit RuvA [Gloeothece citriformis PCC 7424]ACK72839.1 Holliday junction DNA helicase RuvA [Gloeothece citriformis PCC 7424]
MINYLKGKTTQILKTPSNRNILILEVNHIGYEIQIPSRLARNLSLEEDQIVQIFTHLQIREDQQILYGFSTDSERDLFRQLININGVGTQTAIALIDTLGIEALINAIVTNDVKTLSKTPGVGPKTAERIALELKSKLSQWEQAIALKTPVSVGVPSREILEEVEMTLLALGYTDEEIDQAISAISQDNLLLKNPHVEEWLKSAIAWLS